MKVLVILEETLEDNERDCIGVSTSVENADKIVSDYYGLGEDKTVWRKNYYECGDEVGMPVSRYKLEVIYKGDKHNYDAMIWYMEYKIDEV